MIDFESYKSLVQPLTNQIILIRSIDIPVTGRFIIKNETNGEILNYSQLLNSIPVWDVNINNFKEVTIVYTIGQFSRFGMISSKTLRYYDEIDLLKPVHVDKINGYRYYSEDQVEDIIFINDLREFGFTLEEIKLYINKSDNNSLDKALKGKLDELFREEQRITYIRRKIKTKIENMKGNGDFMDSNNNYCTETIEVRITTMEKSIKTAGISLSIPQWPPENPNCLGNLWTRYWEEDISNKIPDKKFPSVRFGILGFINGSINYLITDEILSYESIPEEMIKYEIHEGKYAVCTFNAINFEELVNVAMKKAVDYMVNTWLPKSGFKHTGAFQFEVYDERSRRKNNPEMDIYMPITE